MLVLMAQVLNWLSGGKVDEHYRHETGKEVLITIQELAQQAYNENRLERYDGIIDSHRIVTDYLYARIIEHINGVQEAPNSPVDFTNWQD